ncbi:MAG: right-handed parallel beta-helix repeat-containing protein, partial [Planctomycetota bacterium]|nr:right-handed parallel beta-helix repeat-containing protein [Planctomycetota bacterium]
WSLGATLYYCLSGQQPFGALPFSAWCMAVVDRDPPPVKTLNPAVPQWLSDLCSNCLKRKPGDRPTMSELATQLEFGEALSIQQRSTTKKLGALALLSIIVLATLLFAGWQDVEAPVIVLKSERTLFSKSISDPITIAGRVIDREARWIHINSVRHELTKSGTFRIQLRELIEGSHSLTLLAEDSSGNLSSAMSIQATVDWTPPDFELKSVASVKGVLRLIGSVSDDSVSLKINGTIVSLERSKFVHEIPIAKVSGDLQFELTDKAKHKTVGRPKRLFIVGPRSRTQSLAKALQRTPPGGTIVLLSGLYRCHSEIDKDVVILGLTGQKSVLLKTEQAIRINNSAKVNFSNLSIEGTRKDATATLFIHGGAMVSMDHCRVSTVGLRGIQIQGSKRLEAVPALRIQNSTVQRSTGPSLVVSRGEVWAKDCIFRDPGPSLQANGEWAQAGVELRENSTGRFENCQMNNSLDRGVLLKRSKGEFINCHFKRSMCEGAMLQDEARATFRGCEFIHNSYSGVFINRKSYAVFVDCKFIKNGNEGSALDRTNGLRIHAKSSVQLINTEVRLHLNKGVILKDSRLNIYNCRIEDNAGGDILNAGSVITRRAPAQ